MQVIAVTGLKGGVGKTATAVNLAALSSAAGHRTLVWDLDPQGAATHCFRLKPKVKGGAARLLGGDRELRSAVKATDNPLIDVVPGDVTMRNADVMLASARKPTKVVRRLLTRARRDYDVAILDCAPGLGTVAETVAGVADLLLIPVVASPLGLRAFEQYAAFCEDHLSRGNTVTPFLSLIDRRKPMHRNIESRVRGDRRFLSASVPLSSAVERLGDEQIPTVTSAPHSLASAGYRRLWAEVSERIGLDDMIDLREPAPSFDQIHSPSGI